MELNASIPRRNPYSATRHAGKDVFVQAAERQLGAWRPVDIADCWAPGAGGAPSFWIAGERQAGKTSFLLWLEHLLLTRRPPAGFAGLALPLYVCCKERLSLHDFYAALFRRAELVLREAVPQHAIGGLGEEIRGGELWMPSPGETAPAEPELFELAGVALARLGARLAGDGGRGVRLVLLVDHPDAAGDSAWIPALFAHLRALLTHGLPPAEAGSTPPATLAVALAGGRELAVMDAGPRLLDVLEEVALRPLAWPEVRALVTEPLDLQLDNDWVDRIYRATGGHPWLVQYVMERAVNDCHGEPRLLEHQFDSIITDLFQRDGGRTQVLQAWLERLPDRGAEILSHLALDGLREPDRDLARRIPLPARDLDDRLRRMVELGVVFKPAFQAGDRYALTGIFESWFLEHTGGRVFLEEIQRRDRERAPAGEREGGGKPFHLLLSAQPALGVAEGFYSCFYLPPPGLAESIDALRYRALIAKTERELDLLARDLARDCGQAQWTEVWNHYLQEMKGKDPRCILRIEDPRLYDFPIELMRYGGQFLGLEMPVFKELMGFRVDPDYHLSAGCFPPGQTLNLLLVASSFAECPFEGRSYPPLEGCEQEVSEIVRALEELAARGGLAIGRVVVLTNGKETLPAHVERRPATIGELGRALTDRASGFHLFHYSGHYVATSANGRGGLLLAGDAGGVQLFDFTNLQQCLRGTSLRLVFFNACRSAVHDTDPTAYYLGAASTALHCGVPVVIGNRWPIGDGDARLLGRSFYTALARCGSPEVALWEARLAVRAQTAQQSIVWAAPVMLAR
jgi:hypothetical protein